MPLSLPMASRIARRELGALLAQPLTAVVLGGWLLLAALVTLWLDDVWAPGRASLVRAQLGFGASLLLWVPAVSTSAWGGRPGRTLASLPVHVADQVLGQWLAQLALVGVALALTVPWPVAMAWHGPLDWGPVLAGYGALGLFGAWLCGVGVAAAAWLERPATAFLAAVLVGGVPWCVGLALPLVPATWIPWVLPWSPVHHLRRMAEGSVELASVAAFVGATAMALRLAVHALHRRRLS